MLDKYILLLGQLVFAFMLTVPGFSAGKGGEPVRVMFYNVENLFDTVDDTTINDEEFLPSGSRGWGVSRYNDKINSIYKVIAAAGEWSPPAIVAFSEVENIKVIEDLVYRTNLYRYGYKIVHEDSPDLRGIDVCLIYREDLVNIIDYEYIAPPGWSVNGYRSRFVLHATCGLMDDTIHLFVNHWPSRRGGVMATQGRRMELAEMLKAETDSLGSLNGRNVKIIVVGDFNSSPDDEVISVLTEKRAGEMISLVNISKKGDNAFGTYKYQGEWEIIDQIIVSKSLLSARRGIYTDKDMFSIFDPDFLMTEDNNYPGDRPFSTWWGYTYQGGYSDHLPVLIDLLVR